MSDSDTAGRAIDEAVTAEVIRNALAVAVEEASIAVVRAAHSTWIQEGADAGAALLDCEGALVSLSTATSLMHAASLRCALPYLLEEHPLSSMSPGDVFTFNDPYRGGIHANDFLVFRPIFADGEVRYFAGTLIHVADVGGVSVAGLASLATDTFAEGILFPPVHLYRSGRPESQIMRIIERNSRAPEKVMGDIKALVAAANVLGRRVEELVGRYGASELERWIVDYLDYTERRMKDALRTLPSGPYSGSFTIDSDGVDEGRSFQVVVEVRIHDGVMTLDFTGTSEQARGPINASYSQALSGIIYGVRCYVDRTIPMNEGCYRAVDVHLPAGSLVNPDPPAACGGRIVTVCAAIDAIIDALSDVRPDLAVAPSGLIHVFSLTGRDEAGAPWLNMFSEFGGIGGRHGSDGPDATGCFIFGGRSVIPQIEPIEAQYPLLVTSAALRIDSGGAGKWRGGLGIEMSLRLATDSQLTVRGDRMLVPPPGRDGGESGDPGKYSIERVGGGIDELQPRQTAVRLDAGDTIVIRTSGGGGLGPPRERDVESVREDVRDGRITVEAAAALYGVVLADESRSVDDGAHGLTRTRRGGSS